MPILDGKEQERKGVMETASLMLLSARTAPKARGIDDILTAVVYGQELEDLAADLDRLLEERKADGWGRTAQLVRGSEVVILIGARGTKRHVTNCGACGYSSCEEFDNVEKKLRNDFDGPTCTIKALDLGIAIGSAVKTASILNVDNRIFYRIGVAAKRLNYLPEASIIMGIPLSARGKNPYFDRA